MTSSARSPSAPPISACPRGPSSRRSRARAGSPRMTASSRSARRWSRRWGTSAPSSRRSGSCSRATGCSPCASPRYRCSTASPSISGMARRGRRRASTSSSACSRRSWTGWRTCWSRPARGSRPSRPRCSAAPGAAICAGAGMRGCRRTCAAWGDGRGHHQGPYQPARRRPRRGLCVHDAGGGSRP